MVKKPEDKKLIGAQASREQYNRLKAEAERQDRSMSWVILAAIEFYLEKQQPEFSSRMKK